MNFPKLSKQFLLERLELPEGKLNMVLDTDTFNEIDDQFALVYALKSKDRLNVEAVYAAPFSNDRADTPGEGMIKSYEEILRVLSKINVNPEGLVYKGSSRYLESVETPWVSEAALDLVKRAMSSKEPLYVVAIAAITNIASAILLEPKIIEKIVVVWLGGHSLYWNHTDEFNLMQDITASRVIFDSGVPVIQIPCMSVASHLTTSVPELECYLDGKSPVGTYLTSIFRDYQTQYKKLSKEIWDISAVAYLLNPKWVPANLVHSPILTDHLTWSVDTSRHFMKSAVAIDRNAIFKDLYKKITEL